MVLAPNNTDMSFVPSLSAEADRQNPAALVKPVFMPVVPLVAFDEFIGVVQVECSVPESIMPYGCVVNYLRVLYNGSLDIMATSAAVL